MNAPGPPPTIPMRSLRFQEVMGFGAAKCILRPATMVIQAFQPKFMKVGVLTAALQELTPRAKRDPDPDLAIEEWVAFARELGVDYIQLPPALHPAETVVPPEALLAPVANPPDLRQAWGKDRARRVQAALH